MKGSVRFLSARRSKPGKFFPHCQTLQAKRERIVNRRITVSQTEETEKKRENRLKCFLDLNEPFLRFSHGDPRF